MFVIALFLCTMNYLGTVLFLGNMHRFGNLSWNSSSTSASEEEEAGSAIEKGLPLTVPMHSNKMNDFN